MISLLADEDPAIYKVVRQKLLSFGSEACHWLRPHMLSSNALMRRRALEIVNHFAKQNSDESFLAFCLNTGEELDLEHGTGLLARTQYPDTNLLAYQALYDSWADELRARINFADEAREILGAVNTYLFDHLGFRGEEHYGDDPENCYLNRVVDKRAGNPISLCTLYLFVARRLRLPVTGIGLPGHFLCRFQSSTAEIYIDCFHGGRFLAKADCIRHLINANHSLQDGYLSPVSTRRILLRMCSNLYQTYANLEMRDEAARIQRYLVALAK